MDSSVGVATVAVIYPAHASFSVCRAENLLIGFVFLEPRPSTLAPVRYNKRCIGWVGDDQHRVQRFHDYKTKRRDSRTRSVRKRNHLNQHGRRGLDQFVPQQKQRIDARGFVAFAPDI
jgi:hypothetical protein